MLFYSTIKDEVKGMAEMYLTPEQVAARLQLHPETVRRQLKSGVLRGVRRGRVWRVPESALRSPSSNELGDPKAANDAQSIARDLALIDELDALVNRLPNPRAQSGLPPLSDEDILDALYDRN